MELIDTHSHIYDEAFDADFDEMLMRAGEASVTSFVMPGIDSSTHGRVIEVADRLPGMAFPCIGLHPTSVGENWRDEIQFVLDHIGDRRFYAVGEIGLDEYWSRDFVKEQILVCERQIELAAKENLPVIIHLREATDDFFKVLSDLKGVDFKGVMHAFSGSYETYCRLLKYADFKFGIGGVATYRNAGIGASLERMSLQDIVLETDCPWLTPVPFRGKRNEPAYMTNTAQKVAQIKGLTYEEVALATSRNARILFGI
ncbi:MAG: TatD family hydrolase [Bacteroidales bacterium]|nr:TatD family hydrolase [Candidatus Cacconaster merdequi]